MNRLAVGVFKLVLFAYPASFRRDYGDAMVQSLVDRHRHGAQRQAPLVFSEIFDAVRAASRMRWESAMNRMVVIIIGATAAVATTVAVGPLPVIPIAVLAVAAGLWWFRQGRPIGPASPSRRGLAWLAAGIVGIGIAVLIPAVDGGELNEFWWTVMAVSLLAGIAMAIFGTFHTVTGRPRRPNTAASQ